MQEYKGIGETSIGTNTTAENRQENRNLQTHILGDILTNQVNTFQHGLYTFTFPVFPLDEIGKTLGFSSLLINNDVSASDALFSSNNMENKELETMKNFRRFLSLCVLTHQKFQELVTVGRRDVYSDTKKNIAFFRKEFRNHIEELSQNQLSSQVRSVLKDIDKLLDTYIDVDKATQGKDISKKTQNRDFRNYCQPGIQSHPFNPGKRQLNMRNAGCLEQMLTEVLFAHLLSQYHENYDFFITHPYDNVGVGIDILVYKSQNCPYGIDLKCRRNPSRDKLKQNNMKRDNRSSIATGHPIERKVFVFDKPQNFIFLGEILLSGNIDHAKKKFEEEKIWNKYLQSEVIKIRALLE